MPELELRIDASRPWEGQVCDVRDSEDKAEITKVEWIDGKPLLAFTLLKAGRLMGGEVVVPTEGQDG